MKILIELEDDLYEKIKKYPDSYDLGYIIMDGLILTEIEYKKEKEEE